jgi:hypothetical protein
MGSKVSDEIAKKVTDCVRGRTPLRELRDYLAPIVWDIESLNDPDAESLAYGVELVLAEHDQGHISQSELSQKLLSLLPSHLPSPLS